MTTHDVGPWLIWAAAWPDVNKDKDRKHMTYQSANGPVGPTTLCGKVVYRSELDKYTEGIKDLPLCQTCGWEARKITCQRSLQTLSDGDGLDSSSEQATESTETPTQHGEVTLVIEPGTEAYDKAMKQALDAATKSQYAKRSVSQVDDGVPTEVFWT